jgi:hypothetical protein
MKIALIILAFPAMYTILHIYKIFKTLSINKGKSLILLELMRYSQLLTAHKLIIYK